MTMLMLFTDGSMHTQSKIGYGAYLAISEITQELPSLREQVKVIRFEQTSSTKLELQTLLSALKEITIPDDTIQVYTDSQNIIGLPKRRLRLEQNDYFSKKNKRFNNYKLYQEFYAFTDRYDLELIKVRGHKQTRFKDEIEKIFTLVDRASREALRKEFC
ncbi:MAG: ribonuclease H [Fibrobacteria bacterium]|nr:ribonuclease H [Fibrobacteria bacterium]